MLQKNINRQPFSSNVSAVADKFVCQISYRRNIQLFSNKHFDSPAYSSGGLPFGLLSLQLIHALNTCLCAVVSVVVPPQKFSLFFMFSCLPGLLQLSGYIDLIDLCSHENKNIYPAIKLWRDVYADQQAVLPAHMQNNDKKCVTWLKRDRSLSG